MRTGERRTGRGLPMRRSPAERENGRRDVRALPVALTVWAVSLGAWSGAWRHVAWVSVACMLGLGIVTVVIAASIMARHGRGCVGEAGWSGWVGQAALWMVTVGVAACCALLSAESHAQAGERDALARAVAEGDGSAAWLDAMVIVPPTISDRRGHDCRFDVRASAAAVMQGSGPVVAAPSRTVARVYANGPGCAVARGGVYRFVGTVEKAEYGARAIWLSTDGPAGDADSPPAMLANPPPWHRLATLMRARFQRVTERLPDQGRVLVPGLTLGVLGNEAVVGSGAVAVGMAEAGIAQAVAPEESAEPVDGKVAQAMEDRFRDAGIMHLMAVSGGHFIMLAEAVRRLCRRWLICQQLSAGAIAGAYLVLALLVYPSDSVTRALIMGLIGAGAYALGRRSQSLSALCWTVTGTLILEPKMSQSYGFALSSAAVLGMVLFAGPIGKALGRMLPEALAQMVAMTVAAQLFTLPIQILMEPELPLLSIPANILVSPVVGFSTITGLMALACAWCLPWLAGALAWVASAGTLVMERVAMWLGGSTWSVMPWPDGISGAVLVLLIEAACMVIVMAVSRFARHRTMQDIQPSGQRFGSSRRVRFAIWWQETRRMLHMTASDGST